MIVFMGCSKENNPMTPTIADSEPSIMGAYELTIDEKTLDVILTPKRGSSLYDKHIVSGLNFFTLNPCNDCFYIESVGLDNNNNIVLDIHIKHPFDPAKRPDLDVFDTALVVVPSRDTERKSFVDIGEHVYTDICTNQDGFTKELEHLIGNNTCCPFFLIVDDSKTGFNTWNVFETGSTCSFSATFKKGGYFNLYLTMSYSSNEGEYVNPQFNREVPWKVEAIPPTFNHHDGWNKERDLIVKVYTWRPNNIYTVMVSIPEMTTGFSHDSVSGNGNPYNPLVFIIPIRNETLRSVGVYTGIVEIMNEYENNYGELIHTPDGVTNDYYRIDNHSTYQTFEVTVE